ncbi:MAG: tRNA uridine-5-carboxymethylaminomethyl(34) synthesis GTPase MnmE [Rhodospirillales bacterium]|nr:tRNA uridine-5-carboxymethylaminomethyl(34) synthesis GTPase MnmE [Rhodospirillales bacterium]
MTNVSDTIFALATVPGRSGVAIVRVSGCRAKESLQRLTGRTVWSPRRAVRVRLQDGHGLGIDDALALWFPGPASYTGEDVGELHVHGGRAVIDAILEVLGCDEGLRVAEPGEFTRRAFENGKLDLTQVEAVADLVAAETTAQRRQALQQLEGGLGALYQAWRSRILQALAHLEASIDFADEELPEGLEEEVRREAAQLAREISEHLKGARRGERIRLGFSVVLAGAPNVGKSSLLNCLAHRDAAIVDAEAGTTRDVVSVAMEIHGYPVVVSDTAGLRVSQSRIEREGVRRARTAIERADLVVAVFDGGRWPELDDETMGVLDDKALVVINKMDVCPAALPEMIGGRRVWGGVSARTGEGIGDLVETLGRRLGEEFGGGGGATPSRSRHRDGLQACKAALMRSGDATDVEIVAEELRLAASALGRITGRIGVEDVLEVIFAEFCIGK